MAITAWSDFLSEVLVSAPGCPTPTAENAIRRAAIELCEFSMAHRVTLDAQDAVINDPLVDLSYDSGTDVVRVLDAYFGESRLFATTPETLAECRSNWPADTGIPTHYLADMSEGALRLYPIPDRVGAVTISVSLQPKKTATGVDSVIANKYFDGIVSGALARLCLIPNQTWTEPNLAAVHADRFNSYRLKAQADAIKSFTRAPLRTLATTR